MRGDRNDGALKVEAAKGGAGRGWKGGGRRVCLHKFCGNLNKT